jgi:hemerythrin-like domain-containing protein
MLPSHRPLPAHHQDIERAFEALAARAHEGDPVALRAEWTAFEAELESHLDMEERELIPLFCEQHPEEARALCDEHAEIRAALTQLGIDLDLHALRADAVTAFVEKLRAHARREDRLLYPWVERHPPAGVWTSTGGQLRWSSLARSSAPRSPGTSARR